MESSGVVEGENLRKRSGSCVVDDGSGEDQQSPLKKRERNDVDFGTPNDGNLGVDIADVNSPVPKASAEAAVVDVAALENKARRELCAFLESKKIDQSHADKFEVHVRISKKKRSSSSSGLTSAEAAGQSTPKEKQSDEVRFSTTYSAPDGSTLHSKHDVCSYISNLVHKKSRTSLGTTSGGGLLDLFGHGGPTRAMVSEQAHEKLQEAESQLPLTIDGITVLSFGVFQDHPSLVTSVQIYPMGYKVEFPEIPETQTGSNSSSSSSMKSTSKNMLRCEVSSINGHPEFSVLNVKTGQVHVAFSESSLWKKV